jgi:hypothetical protein
MRPVLKPYAPVRSLGDLVLRVTECLTVMAAGVCFLTSRQLVERLRAARPHAVWRGRAVPGLGLADVQAGAAGPVAAGHRRLRGAAARDRRSRPASGAGIVFLVPGGLFELAFPLLLIVRSLSVRSGARLRGRGGLAVTTRRSRTSAQVTASAGQDHRVSPGSTGSNRLEESVMPDVSGPGVAPLPPARICLRRPGWTD